MPDATDQSEPHPFDPATPEEVELVTVLQRHGRQPTEIRSVLERLRSLTAMREVWQRLGRKPSPVERRSARARFEEGKSVEWIVDYLHTRKLKEDAKRDDVPPPRPKR